MLATTCSNSKPGPIRSTMSKDGSSSSTIFLVDDEHELLQDIALTAESSALICALDNNSERCGQSSLDGSTCTCTCSTSRTLSVGSGSSTTTTNATKSRSRISHKVTIEAEANAEADALRAQVESLRQQLGERDAIVNQLQRQIQQDKRNHDKLQKKWNLFFGFGTSANTNTNPNAAASTSTITSMASSPRSTSSIHSNTTNNAELVRVKEHLEQLERDKNAALSKAIQLSVALAESRAAVSTLQAQLEESRTIIRLQQNTANSGIVSSMLGFKRQPAQPAADIHHTILTPTKEQSSPLPITCTDICTDIQLNEPDDHHHHDDDSQHEDPLNSRQEDDHSRYITEDASLESESLSSWSQRPCLGHLSEHSDYSSRRHSRGHRATISNQSERINNSYRFTSSLRGFLGSGSQRNMTSPTSST
jgi:hypothetical protein